MALRVLNTPAVKEAIKNVLGTITFAGGVTVLYRTRKGSSAQKTADFFLKASIVLSCLASRPGLWLLEKVISRIATPQAFAKIFGQNTIFEINPWHPRHALNITANILSGVALIEWIYNWRMDGLIAMGVFNPSSRKIGCDFCSFLTLSRLAKSHLVTTPRFRFCKSLSVKNLLKSLSYFLELGFNFVTGRSTLHLVNDL